MQCRVLDGHGNALITLRTSGEGDQIEEDLKPPGSFWTQVLDRNRISVHWDGQTFQGQNVEYLLIWTEPNDGNCSLGDFEFCVVPIDTRSGPWFFEITDLTPCKGCFDANSVNAETGTSFKNERTNFNLLKFEIAPGF